MTSSKRRQTHRGDADKGYIEALLVMPVQVDSTGGQSIYKVASTSRVDQDTREVMQMVWCPLMYSPHITGAFLFF